MIKFLSPLLYLDVAGKLECPCNHRGRSSCYKSSGRGGGGEGGVEPSTKLDWSVQPVIKQHLGPPGWGLVQCSQPWAPVIITCIMLLKPCKRLTGFWRPLLGWQASWILKHSRRQQNISPRMYKPGKSRF